MYSLQIKENRQFFFFFFLWYKETWHALNQVQKIKHVRGFLGSQQLFKCIQGYLGSIRYSAVSFELHEKASGVVYQSVQTLWVPWCVSELVTLWSTLFHSQSHFFKDFNPPRVCFVPHVTQKLTLSWKLWGVSHWNKATLFLKWHLSHLVGVVIVVIFPLLINHTVHHQKYKPFKGYQGVSIAPFKPLHLTHLLKYQHS